MIRSFNPLIVKGSFGFIHIPIKNFISSNYKGFNPLPLKWAIREKKLHILVISIPESLINFKVGLWNCETEFELDQDFQLNKYE